MSQRDDFIAWAKIQGYDLADPTFGQVTLSETTGTAPLVVTSTTVCTNLNTDLWDGYQFTDYLDQAVKTTSTPTFAKLGVVAAAAGPFVTVTSTDNGSYTNDTPFIHLQTADGVETLDISDTGGAWTFTSIGYHENNAVTFKNGIGVYNYAGLVNLNYNGGKISFGDTGWGDITFTPGTSGLGGNCVFVQGDVVVSIGCVDAVAYKAGGTAAVADGTYANPTSITTKGGIITAIS